MNMRALARCAPALLCAAMACAGEEPPRPGGGMSLSPAVFLVQNIPPGTKVDLVAVAPSTELVIGNRGASPTLFALAVRTPAEAKAVRWERGYEALPESAWAAASPSELTIAGASTGKAGVVLDIPGRPELRNRRFVACVAVAPRAADGSMAVALLGRVLIETASSATDVPGGALALWPSTVELPPQRPGATAKATAKLRNNAPTAVRYQTGRIGTVVQRPDTYDRYRSHATEPLIGRSWIAESPRSLALEPGTQAEIAMAVTVPIDARPGTTYEELVFVESLDGPKTGNDREPGGATGFVRVRIPVQ